MEVRHRGAPLLHEGARGPEPVARDPGTGGLPAAAPAEPDLLRGDLLRLPDPFGQCAAWPRDARGDPVRPLVLVGACAPSPRPRHLRGLDGPGLRMASLSEVLQGLHREGVGDTTGRDQGGLGRAENQEPDARERDPQRVRPEPQESPHHLARRGVPLPAPRSGDDVGACPGVRGGPRLGRLVGHAARVDTAVRGQGRDGADAIGGGAGGRGYRRGPRRRDGDVAL